MENEHITLHHIGVTKELTDAQFLCMLNALTSCPPKITDDPVVNYYVDMNVDYEPGDPPFKKWEEISEEERCIYIKEVAAFNES